jgi:hypothetical protein
MHHSIIYASYISSVRQKLYRLPSSNLDLSKSPTEIMYEKITLNRKRLSRTIVSSLILIFILFATLLDNQPRVVLDYYTSTSSPNNNNNNNNTTNIITTNNSNGNFIVLLTCSNGFYDMFLNWLLLFGRLQIPNLPVYLFAEDEDT